MSDQNLTGDALTADLSTTSGKTPNPSVGEFAVRDVSSELSGMTFPMSPGDAEELLMASFRVAGMTGMSQEYALGKLKDLLEWDYKMRSEGGSA